MKTPKWTTADAKRAEKIGWRLDCENRIVRLPERFKSDDEAIEYVLDMCEYTRETNGPVYQTCRKALFLCAKG